MASLTASRAKVSFVMAFAGAASFVLPVGAEGLVVLAQQQFTSNVFGDGLVRPVPDSGSITFDDSVRETPQIYWCRQGAWCCLHLIENL